jgi:hypothetical protein
MSRREPLPIGAEKLNREGHVMIKISMLNKRKEGVTFGCYRGTWKLKKNLIWEQCNGPIPKGYNVICLDNNRDNLEPDNLALATNNEIMLLRHYGMQSNDTERTRTGLAIVRHRALLGKLMKQTHNTYNMPKLKKGKNGNRQRQ